MYNGARGDRGASHFERRDDHDGPCRAHWRSSDVAASVRRRLVERDLGTDDHVAPREQLRRRGANKIGFRCGLSRELIPELNSDWDKHSLFELLEQAGKEFMKIWLFVDGPERILAWAADKNPKIDWENRYGHHCHACLALFENPLVRETIAKNYHERVEEVLIRYSVLLRHQELLEGAVYG
jgi:hypothetical protein